MQWTKQQTEGHKKAAKLLIKIKDETFQYLKSNKNISEFEVQEFVKGRFKNYGMKTDAWRPIIGFRENTGLVHYYASEKKAKKLKPESLVLVDIWARMNKKGAPFADITWMGYCGKAVPVKIERIFDIVIKARDAAISGVKLNIRKKMMPTGREIDLIAKDHIGNAGLGKYFLHGTGHSLGFINDHGRGVNLNQKGKGRLSKMIGYTIEPGIYIKNKFGFRSEIDFYVDEKYKLIVTTKMQKKIVIL